MKRIAIILSTVLLGFTACNKSSIFEKGASTDETAFIDEVVNDDADLEFNETDFSKTILLALEKPDDYDYYTKGVIQFSKDDKVLATIDYGNGERDSWATKDVDGKVTKFDMSKKKQKDCKFDKKVVEPIVKSEGCKYIVSGIVKYYKNGKWVATVDYGDGTCDNLATKTWKGGTKTFDLDYDYKKKGQKVASK